MYERKLDVDNEQTEQVDEKRKFEPYESYERFAFSCFILDSRLFSSAPKKY